MGPGGAGEGGAPGGWAGGGFGRSEARAALSAMWRVRRFEEALVPLKHASEVYGLLHVSIGQEAVAAGTCLQLGADEVVYSNHRAHGHALCKGAAMGPTMAELMGRSDGLCGGLGGSMHLVDRASGFLGATGVVGGNLAMAVGSALAGRLAGDERPVTVFFGDGAVQGGLFSETVNLASLWSLPVVFVCENNGFAEFTPRSAHTRVARVVDLVEPYAVVSEVVDGNDVAAVHAAFAAALAAARGGGGPYLLECLTDRLAGHYVGDPARYREALADDEWRARDPIARLERRGLAEGWFDDATVAAAGAAAAAAEVAEAVRFASASPYPAPDAPARLVYAPVT